VTNLFTHVKKVKGTYNLKSVGFGGKDGSEYRKKATKGHSPSREHRQMDKLVHGKNLRGTHVLESTDGWTI
jgi:hypothetical protein